MRSQVAQLRHVPRALGLVWAAARAWTAVSLLIPIVQGLWPLATVYLTRDAVNALGALVASRGDARLLPPAITQAALLRLVGWSAGYWAMLTPMCARPWANRCATRCTV